MLSLNAKQSQIKTRSALLLNYEETRGLSKSFSFQKLCLFILRGGKLEFFPIRERRMTASDGEVLDGCSSSLPPSLLLLFFYPLQFSYLLIALLSFSPVISLFLALTPQTYSGKSPTLHPFTQYIQYFLPPFQQLL